MKKLVLTLLVASFATIGVAACKKKSTSNNKITVNFYLDYNEIASGEVYYTYEVKNGSKLKEPPTPTQGTFPEFPTFKGWSHREIIDKDEDLWDFSKDVAKTEEGYSEFNMFGIWVAEGE